MKGPGRGYKQPHEDVRGTDRTDMILSLEEGAQSHRDMILTLARVIQRATLVGDPAPIVTEIYNRLTDPKIGDFVVEVGGPYKRDAASRAHSFGVLVEHRREWWESDAEWAGSDDNDPDDRLTDEAWYVQYGPSAADICRWTDARFVSLNLGDVGRW